MTDMRTPLGKVRGLGSARDGTTHFWRQRVTAVANVFLMSFFMDFEFQPTPPAPSDSKVVITHLDEFRVYVAEYSGFSDDSKFSSTLKGLVAALQQGNRVWNATKCRRRVRM